MTPSSFEMDNYMPDWTEDFDFGAFLNLPPDDVDQGGEDGSQRPTAVNSDVLDPDRFTHSSTAWGFGGSDHASDLTPELCDERRIDVLGPSYTSTHPGFSENPGSCQNTNTQPQTKNASPGIDYGADSLGEDESGASGYLQPAYATVLKITGPETVTMEDCREACTIPSTQDPSWSFIPDPAKHETPENHCACIDCLNICGSWAPVCPFPSCQTRKLSHWELSKHGKSHYGQPGKYTCLEQNCEAVTKGFGDLKRHYKAKHCTDPNKEQFPCPVLWCKYSGNNGFARKDKLQSHYKNVHEGKPGPVRAGRVIKPATLKPKVSGYGGSAGKQKE